MGRTPSRVGDYDVLGLLGRGGMGAVYLARSPRSELVAVKVMHERLTGSPEYRARFRQEVQAASLVGGGYTAAVLDCDADPRTGSPWLVTRYLPGLSLRHALALATADGTPLPADTMRALAAGLAAGLAAIHDAQVVHRDLKPDNVVLTGGGPRVIDFGIARPENATPLTVPGRLPHNGPYLAPEQRAGQPASRAADVFALGGVLLFAATGRDPSGAGGEPDLGVFTDPVLRRAVAACLRAEPERRPTARDLVERIGEPSLPLAGTGWLPKPIAEPIQLLADDPGRIPEITGSVAALARSGVEDLPTDLPGIRTPWRRRGPSGARTPWQRGGLLGARAPWQRRGLLGVRTPLRRRGLLGLAGAGLAVTAVGGWWWLGRPPRPAPGLESPGQTAPGLGSPAQSAAPPPAVQRWSAAVASGYPDVDTAGDLVLAWSANAVRALDARTGQPRWHRAARGGDTGGAALASGTSALRGPVGGGRAFLLDSASYPFAVTAVRTDTGAALWQYTLPGYPDPAPVLAGAVLILPGDGLLALDAASGEPRWQADADASNGLTAGAGPAAGAGLAVAAGAGALAAFDAATGAGRWRYGLKGGSDPLVAGDLVVVRDGAGTVHAVTAANGRPAWQRAVGAVGAMRYGAGMVYATGADGTVHALGAGNGVPAWSRRIGAGEGQAYGRANVLAIDAVTLYVAGTDRTVYALEAATGRVRWTFGAQATLGSPPATAAGLVFVGTADGAVRALAAPSGASR